MIRLKSLYPFLVAAGTLFFAACSPSLVITVHTDDSADIAFSANPSPAGASLVRRFSGSGNGETPLYDRDAVSEGIAAMGIRLELLSFPSGDGLSFSGTTANLAGIPGGALLKSSAPAGITLCFSPDSVNGIMGNLPAETRDLLELLMAPVFTGENLSRDEYREILASAYGEKAAEELSASSCTIHLRAPQPVRSARASGPDHETVSVKYAGKTVTASIPLDLLLTLRKPLNLAITW